VAASRTAADRCVPRGFVHYGRAAARVAVASEKSIQRSSRLVLRLGHHGSLHADHEGRTRVSSRLGVDVGGTFTDLVFLDDQTGSVGVAKLPTTLEAPEEAVLGVIRAHVPSSLLQSSTFFLHAATVGLNALLERRGAVVGLLTTRGFRDVLEIRRGDREAVYDAKWTTPPPLVPRRLRLPVTERVRADGVVETPLVAADVRGALEVFVSEGVECIAIVFLNSFANPEHELAAERILREAGFTGDISLSHRVSGQFREYERTSTTVIDAYVRPQTTRYLQHLREDLEGFGFHGSCLVTRSGGGAMTFEEAKTSSFETIMSGPAAGAVGAAHVCADLGIPSGISADVGGTSFDCCLIVDGHPQVKHEGRIAGMPLQAPWVDVRSIGAGGGSVAFVDAGALLRVGPRSAGAVPGPACYGRGGTEPTVTDAAAVLGLLGHGELAGGLRLDFTKARRALEPLGRAIGLDVGGVAEGILKIASASMAGAIRSVTVEQGQDPRRASLIAFGGAGPLFGTLLARELQIRQVVVPKHAGNFSAWGLLAQDIMRSAARTHIRKLDDEGLSSAAALLRALFDDRHQDAKRPGADQLEDVPEAALDLRYTGQDYTLTVPVPFQGGRVTVESGWVHQAFEQDYERTYGHTLTEPVEIVSVRATLRTPLPRLRSDWQVAEHLPVAAGGAIDAHSFTRGERASFPLLSRSEISPGTTLPGPVIVLEETATTYVDAGFELSVHPSGILFLNDVGVA